MVLFGRRRREGGNNGRKGCLDRGMLLTVVAVVLVLLSTSMGLRHTAFHRSLVYSSQSHGAKTSTGDGQSMMKVDTNIAISFAMANPLGIFTQHAKNLPSLGATDPSSVVDDERKIYGGKGDGKHLGGFTELDLHGVSPATWTYMLQTLGVHSVLDVGCGKGVSTSWFHLHGCRVQCVEGSHDAVANSIIGGIDPTLVVEHDFSRGPWWPDDTFDAVWAVEFLEHVGVNYQYNYLTAFRKAALLFVTSSRWGGWHHVEVHSDDWWIRKYEAYGFRYDAQLTDNVRNVAQKEAGNRNANHTAPNGEAYNAQHVWLTMKVFVNPVVAALPQHAHLFPEHGCYGGRDVHRVCGEGKDGALESALPREYWPLSVDSSQDEAWSDLIRQHITIPTEGTVQ